MDPAITPKAALADATKILIQLQDLDTETASWEKQRLTLNQKVEESKAEVKACQIKQEELKKQWDSEKKKRGLLELEVKTKEAEIAKYNGQLVTLDSNEAYTAMLKEIDSAKAAIKKVEDQMLELIENEENIAKKFEADAAALKAQTVEAEARQKQMAAEAEEFNGKVKAKASGRDELVKALSPVHVTMYERHLKAHQGQALARVKQNKCGKCQMRVPPFQEKEIRRQMQFQYCQNCGVIMVMDESEAY